ncbi:MAG: TrkH family potassium uptake protein [Deltaproteobacteria bacterium]|nr:TrkH family potassium uptake protein [Deltaproteobacteria bacterium]
MAKQATELRYAVRRPVIAKYFGQLCLVLAMLTMAPLLVSLLSGERDIALRYAAVVCGIGGLGLGMARLKAPTDVQANEGMVLVALMFLLTPLAMSFPMMGSGLDFLDAFFEAVSGVTTTGLSTRATVAGTQASFLFSRAWLQWYGGLGIIVLSLALVMQPGLAAKGLAAMEGETDDLVGGTRSRAQRVLKVYGALTVLGILGSLLAGFGYFDAVLFTFAAVSTGGFAPSDLSLAGSGWLAQGWVTLLCLAGAIPLTIYHRMLQKERRAAADYLQTRAVVIASVIASLAVGASMKLSAGAAWPDVIHHAPMLAFSAQTTAGFSSMPCGQLDPGSKLVLVFSMLVGGSLGSTGGGFKVLRLLIAASMFRMFLLRTCLPKHAVIVPRIAGRRLQEEEIRAALLLILLYIAVAALSWLPFVAMGYGPLDSLFEVVSAMGTVGLSSGVTSADLPALLKGVLCADMLMGRLEIVAFLVMLYPGTWFGMRMEGT